MAPTDLPPPEPTVVAQGAVQAMRALCDELRRAGLDAALVPPPGGCATG
jgi:hypothetical protein